jgi:hypothetical protein
MASRFVIVVLAVVTLACLASAQEPRAVPKEYTGDWVCQTFAPGYNLLLPHADLSQPQTNTVTTPSTVRIMKFSMRSDGTYTSPAAQGHYSFDPSTRGIAWLDGPHQTTMSQTQIGRRDNGAPKMEFLFDKRRFGCYIAAPKR